MFQRITVKNDALQWRYVPDVEYANYDGLSRALQLLVPACPQADARYPLIVYLPGSAFYRQDMYSDVPQFAMLARRGFMVAALQYRESQIAKFPAQIRDVHSAITYLKTNAGRFHIDPQRIFLWGHSSGAYNCLMAGVTAGLPEFDGGANHRVRGIVAVSAPSYLSFEPNVLDKGLTQYVPADYQPELDMLGLARFEDDMALFHRSRVESYIHRDIPPILLFHGDLDEDVTVENSRKLYRALTDAGKPVTYYELENAGHGGPMLWEDKLLDLATDFLNTL